MSATQFDAPTRFPISHRHASVGEVLMVYRRMLATLPAAGPVDDLKLMNAAAGEMCGGEPQYLDYWGDGSVYQDRRDCIRDAAMMHLSHHGDARGGQNQPWAVTSTRDWLTATLAAAIADLTADDEQP